MTATDVKIVQWKRSPLTAYYCTVYREAFNEGSNGSQKMCTKTAALRRHDGAENQLSPDLLTMNNIIGYDNILAILCDTFFFWLPFFSFFAIST